MNILTFNKFIYQNINIKYEENNNFNCHHEDILIVINMLHLKSSLILRVKNIIS